MQVTDEHFERGASGGGLAEDEALQNPVQQAAAQARTESQAQTEEPQNHSVLPDPAVLCDSVPSGKVGVPRFELGTSSLSE